MHLIIYTQRNKGMRAVVFGRAIQRYDVRGGRIEWRSCGIATVLYKTSVLLWLLQCQSPASPAVIPHHLEIGHWTDTHPRSSCKLLTNPEGSDCQALAAVIAHKLAVAGDTHCKCELQSACHNDWLKDKVK